jgi:hypothetical protein
MISTRSVGLLIDTVVCLTLAKWETVSGRFGGYLTPIAGVEFVLQSLRKHPFAAPTPSAQSIIGSEPANTVEVVS